MSKKKNHRDGGKMGGRHTTVTDAAAEVVDFTQKLREVKKVVAGIIITGVNSGNNRVKVKDIKGGLLVVVRGRTCIQELRVYSLDVEKTRLSINARF